MMPSRRRITTVFSILLLVSLACTLPSFGVPTPTPTFTAPAQATATTAPVSPGKPLQQQDLPPVLVETDPPVGSEVAPSAALTFYFNQPMDRPSTESALKGQPALAGTFEWVDDSTLRFLSDQPFPTGAEVQLTFDPAARAANGQALTDPVSIHFQVADSLRVTERLPKPGAADANPTSAVVVTFNTPVVALGADPASLAPAFLLQPEAKGRGEWLNTSTYIFYPEPALAGGVKYTVVLDPALKSSGEVPLSLDGLEPREWTFTTALPAVSGLTFGELDRLELDGKITLTFNQPMDTASVEQDLALLDPAGVAVPLTYQWDERGTQLIFQPKGLLARATDYTIRLKGAARSLGGAPIGAEYRHTRTSVPELAVESTSPGPGEKINANYGSGYYLINFTAPLDKQDVAALVSVSPPVGGLRVNTTFDRYSITVEGNFQPSTIYTVTLAAALRDRWGGTLAAPVSLQVATETPPPSLTIPIALIGAPAIFVPTGQTGLDVRLTNVSQAALERRTLTLDEFIMLAGSGEPAQTGVNPVRWNQNFEVPPDRSVSATLSLDPANKALAPGVYWFKVSAPGLDEASNRAYLLISSNIHLTLKLSPRQAMVWAVDLTSNTPVAGLPVSILAFNQDGPLGACTTGDNGVCITEIPERSDIYDALYAVAAQPGDPRFALISSYMNQGISPYEAGMPSALTSDGPFAYLYTDRPIYRPGQTVNFKAVLRQKENARYSLLDLTEVEVKVMPPYDPTLSEQLPMADMRQPVSAFGAIDGSFDLSADAPPGYYTISLPDFKTDLYFQVAEYRKPEMDLQVEFVKPEYQVGSDLQARVSAQYFFGAPVSDLRVTWVLFSRPSFTLLPNQLQAGAFDVSWFYPRDQFAPSVGTFVAQGEAQTGADGTLQVDIPADALANLDLTNRSDLVLEVNAVDETDLPVSARASAVLHPSSFYIGVRPESWNAQAGEELGFTIQVLDWADQPAGEHDLAAVFSRVEWQQDESTAVYGYPSYTKVLTVIATANLRTDALGRARVVFTPPDAGTYQLELSGDGALTQVLVWASGPAVAPWPTLPNQTLRLEADAAEYQPGGTATIRVPNPFAGSALALVSVERSKVMRTYVQPLSSSLEEFKLPLEDIDAPNVFVSVILLGKTSDGLPDYRQGYLNLKVRPDALKLSVETTFNPTASGPGGEVKLGLLVRAPDGSPAQGEFSLSLVDKAVLALADPNSLGIFDAFYGEQSLAVQTSMDLTSAATRMVAAQLGRGGGGGGDASLNNPGERTRFEDTAAWVASFETNADGRAEVTLRLPDNLTTWVADVRGITVDSLVGGGMTELVVSKDLLVRPVAPRFFVAGDRVQLGAVVQNNTGAALSADVSLEAPGLTLEDPASASQSVDVPAGGRTRVNWWGVIQDVPSIDPVFAARSGALEDVTHTEIGDLPVLRYSAQQTYATAGVLAEGGSRLEVVSLPRTFTPTGGELRVELAPSLAATVLQGLEALETFPDDFTEPVISRLLANAAAYSALKDFDLQAPDLQASLERNIREDLRRLLVLQSYDGGWNWNFTTTESDTRMSAYALIALDQAAQADFFVNPDTILRVQQFLLTRLQTVAAESENAQLETQALVMYALQQSGQTGLDLDGLYTLREKLSPSGKALLAMALFGQTTGDERAVSLASDLAGLADRSASGASWQAASDDWRNWSTPVFTTAVVSYALARIDPATPLLTDALRYLVLHRRPNGCWASSYESAWVLLALSQALKSTGDLQANFAYQASLNDALLANGIADGPQSALNPVSASVPLSQLIADGPNALKISRDPGDGRLYYRAFLDVGRPAGDAPAVSRGLFIQREYFTAGQDCREVECVPVTSAELNSAAGLLVRLTVTLPKDMYYLVVEDSIPAGAEIVDPNLKTSRQGFVDENLPADQQFDPSDPFRGGWGWWYFGAAQIGADSVRWVAPYLPAGTYTLTYRLSPVLAGDFQVIPAHAFQNYFPDVEASSAGDILSIR